MKRICWEMQQIVNEWLRLMSKQDSWGNIVKKRARKESTVSGVSTIVDAFMPASVTHRTVNAFAILDGMACTVTNGAFKGLGAQVV
jgi:hypothetical protein